MSRSVIWLSGLLLFGLSLTQWASAQDDIQLSLFPPLIDAFPRISIFLDIHSAQNEFIHDLKAADVRLFEDGLPVPLVEFKEQRPGVQLVFALNPGHSFEIRDADGATRYDQLLEVLAGWAKKRVGSTLDDLSILVSSGPERAHVSNPLELLYALEVFQLGENMTEPSLDTLSKAVDIASDPTPRPPMKRVVLFLSAPLREEQLFGLQNIIDRAIQQKVHIFVWLVAPPEALSSQTVNEMKGLADQTGGRFYAYTTNEPVPELEEYLEPLRDIYYLAYDSNIRAGGAHEISVEVQLSDQYYQAPSMDFNLNLEPPSLAFISPVVEITRKPVLADGEKAGEQINPEDFVPGDYEFKVLVDFPDKRPRSLVRSILFVDNEVADENRGVPFDQFTWDLQQVNTSGQHVLKAEVYDSFGLSGTTIEMPVQVRLEYPAQSLGARLLPNLPLISSVAAAIAGILILLVLIWSGRIHPRPLGFLYERHHKLKSNLATENSRIDRETAVISWHAQTNQRFPADGIMPQTFAYLTCISDEKPPSPSQSFSISIDELTIGNDSKLATMVIDDASVAGLHARLVRREDGSFYLSDQGSLTGTWINYLPVPQQGAILQHGDLVHIGRIGFRFIEREPKRVRSLRDIKRNHQA